MAFLQLALLSEESLETAPFYVREWWMLPVAVVAVGLLLKEIKTGASISLETPVQTSNQQQ